MNNCFSFVCLPVGLTEGASLAVQKEPQTLGHGETPGQPDNTDWRPKQSQEDGKTKLQCMEGRGGGGMVGEDKKGGIKTNEVPGHWGQDSASDMTKTEVRLNEFIHCICII